MWAAAPDIIVAIQPIPGFRKLRNSPGRHHINLTQPGDNLFPLVSLSYSCPLTSKPYSKSNHFSGSSAFVVLSGGLSLQCLALGFLITKAHGDS